MLLGLYMRLSMPGHAVYHAHKVKNLSNEGDIKHGDAG